MDIFYGIVEFLWIDNMYTTILITTIIIGILHSMNQGG